MEIKKINLKNFPCEEILSLFWDIDVKILDSKKHKEYIIERILDFGDTKSVIWIFRNYSSELIKRVLYESRGISNKSSNYWKLYFSKKEEKNA